MLSGVRSVFSEFEDIPLMAYFTTSGLEPTAMVLSLEGSSISAFLLYETMLSGFYSVSIPSGYFDYTGQFVYTIDSGVDVQAGAFYRGVDMSVVDSTSDKNREITFNLATDDIIARNVVRGAVNTITTKIKNSSDDSFDIPIEEYDTYLTYERASITSDVTKKSPFMTSGY